MAVVSNTLTNKIATIDSYKMNPSLKKLGFFCAEKKKPQAVIGLGL